MYLGILGMYSGVTDSIVFILDTWFIDSNIWILDTLYKYLGILLYGFYCINSGVRTPCILFRDFIVCIRYLWILGSPYFGIGLYGFWTSCIWFRDSNVWIRYLGILLYGSGIKGFYCMDFNMSGFGI